MWSRRSRFRRGPVRSFHLLRARNIHLIRCHDSAITNLTLLCRYHHTHFLQKGWTCRINADDLPERIPSWWIDQRSDPKSTHASDASRLSASRNVRDDRPTPHEQPYVPRYGYAPTAAFRRRNAPKGRMMYTAISR
jgi:hypothetical protein